MTVAEIREAYIALSIAEREHVISDLIDLLDDAPSETANVRASWDAVITSRVQCVLDGSGTGLTDEELLTRLGL